MEFKMVNVKRELDEGSTWELLSQASHAVVSTVDADGDPYGVPVSYVLVGERVYLHGSVAAGHRMANLGSGCRACLTVVTQDDVVPGGFTTRYASAMAFGRLRPARDDAEKRLGLEAFLRKYSPDHMEAGLRYIDAALAKTAVSVLEVERVSGKSSVRR